MDALDAGLRALQTVFPPALQYLGNAKDRKAKAAEEKQESAQARAQVEILTIKVRELTQANRGLTQTNEELMEDNEDLQAFKNIVMVLLAVAIIVYVGKTLTSGAA